MIMQNYYFFKNAQNYGYSIPLYIFFSAAKSQNFPIEFLLKITFSGRQVAEVTPVDNCTCFLKDKCTKLWLLFDETVRMHIS